jgi:hypothetical protein
MPSSLIIEDGSGVLLANAYASMDVVVAYSVSHGLAFPDSPVAAGEAAIIRASAAIDAKYRGAFPGYRSVGREQGLEWPRQVAYDRAGWLIDATKVPIEIINATCEAAVRELAAPGSMMPDLARDAWAKRLKAGSVEIEYGANAPAETAYSIIGGLLAGILGGGSGGGLFGVAARG